MLQTVPAFDCLGEEKAFYTGAKHRRRPLLFTGDGFALADTEPA